MGWGGGVEVSHLHVAAHGLGALELWPDVPDPTLWTPSSFEWQQVCILTDRVHQFVKNGAGEITAPS